jgi:Phage integrase, N-terminal SAM-like domain
MPAAYPAAPAEATSSARPGRKILDQVRDALRVRHYSYRTEQAYVGWIRRLILFHEKRHPREMGAREIKRFVTWLRRIDRSPWARYLPLPNCRGVRTGIFVVRMITRGLSVR